MTLRSDSPFLTDGAETTHLERDSSEKIGELLCCGTRTGAHNSRGCRATVSVRRKFQG